MAEIDRYFQTLLQWGGSDLHLQQGQPPKVRVHGRIMPLESEVLTEQKITRMMREICVPNRWEKFLKTGDLDFAYAHEGFARFRANFHKQVHGMGAVFRHIPTLIKTIDELGLPKVLKFFAMLRAGLVLVTGPTGSGKSTTLAAIINHINDHTSQHVVTIEEPIEFVHANKKSVIAHREVGLDVPSFQEGLYTVNRQDADIVLVGEMRDQETIHLALQAAAKGTLVFATLHTNSASKSVDRIIDAFDPEEQDQIRALLADVLKGVCAQLLFRTPDGDGRRACHEVLVSTSGLAASIRDGNSANIRNIIQAGKRLGMQTMDDSIVAHLEKRLIHPQDAYLKALDKQRVRPLVERMGYTLPI